MESMDIKKVLLVGIGSLVVSTILTYVFIPILKKLKVGQEVREEGPESHYGKSGTPTMGGVIIAMIIFIFTLIFVKKDYKVILTLIAMMGFGLIGFLDDAEKMQKKQSLGLTPKQKLILQFALAFIILIVAYFMDQDLIKYINIPFVDKLINISVVSIPLLAFIMVGTVNAVNLTDGLDGLLVGVSLPVFATLTLFAIYLKEYNMSLISIVAFGSLCGFLFFNSNPASIFMGDTGSMAIGGLISILSIFYNIPIYIAIFGGIYLIEALSVIIQVSHYKRTKKRVFLMSPIHHHFELKGHKEQKITVAFSIISTILCALAIIIFF